MRKRWLLLLIAAFFGLALLAVDRYTTQLTPGSQEQADREPDYYGKDLASRQYNQQGKLAQTFRAASSTHYPGIHSTLFTAPEVVIRNTNGELWLVTAAEGTLSDEDKILQLIRDVKIHPLDNASQNNVLIRTEYLTYNHASGIAQTDKPVTITSTQGDLQATGMTMDIPAQHIRFNAEVRSRYVP